MPQMSPLSWFPMMIIMTTLIIMIMALMFWSMPLEASMLKKAQKLHKNMFWKW